MEGSKKKTCNKKAKVGPSINFNYEGIIIASGKEKSRRVEATGKQKAPSS